jgi:pimeloyl-ACP methyl ester carboxylesterase
MPAVFVHGVPDTRRVWNSVIARLDRKDVVALSLPGFDSPVPQGFAATKEAYVDWLLAQLQAIEEPIDLVGHDWGGLLVLRAISLQPDRVRSWATGGAPLDAEYVWHEAAQTWQTPVAGEAMMNALTSEALQMALTLGGIPSADAAETAKHVDATMKDCILKLYRSAVTVGAEWQGDLQRIEAPGLVIWGENDPYVTANFGAKLAERTAAKFVSYANCSHWWQLERPVEVAAELQALWDSCN